MYVTRPVVVLRVQAHGGIVADELFARRTAVLGHIEVLTPTAGGGLKGGHNISHAPGLGLPIPRGWIRQRETAFRGAVRRQPGLFKAGLLEFREEDLLICLPLPLRLLQILGPSVAFSRRQQGNAFGGQGQRGRIGANDRGRQAQAAAEGQHEPKRESQVLTNSHVHTHNAAAG